MSDPIDFYFEFASPYGYFAATRIDALAGRHGRLVAWRPVMLGAIFKVTGMGPVMRQPLRGDYLRNDVPRFARLIGVPLKLPAVMPMNSLAASRAFYWLVERDATLARRLAEAVFHAHWALGGDLSTPEAVADAAAPLGIERDELLAAIQDPAIKQRLKDQTQSAMDRGVFGSPYIVVDGEAFWGADRLDQLDRWLETGGW